MSSSNREELFPVIGKIAEQADNIPANDETQTAAADDEDERVVTEVESLCMKCEEKGTTRLLLTSIPFFGEIVVMSFRCGYCGAQNNEVQPAGEIKPEGTAYTVGIYNRSDLDRQIVRSSTCKIVIPEFELTLPPTQRGQLTNVEGLIRDIVADLSADQPSRRVQNEDAYRAIQKIVDGLNEILGDEEDDDTQKSQKSETLPRPFSVELNDPAGNSFIQFFGSTSDPKWYSRTYHRTLEQNVQLGLVSEDGGDEENKDGGEKGKQVEQGSQGEGVDVDEVFVFPGVCSSCGHPIETKMKKVNIPYFKDVLIMSTNCENCGYRDNEVKSGGAVSEKGKRITLKVEDREDLSRDILKSETAGLRIPEIHLTLSHGTLGGRFTTLEGILEQVYEQLSEKLATSGDSATTEDRARFKSFFKNLKEIKEGNRPFTIILDDPLANSYLQNLYAPDPDPNMTVEMYERTYEQNEELGLNDIKVEGYEKDASAEGSGKKAG